MKCIGFGQYEGKCEYLTGKHPWWCERCDKLRQEHITKCIKTFGQILDQREMEKFK